MFKYPTTKPSREEEVNITTRVPIKYRDLLSEIGGGNTAKGLACVLYTNELKMINFVKKLKETDKNHDKNAKQTVKKKSK